MRIAGARGSPRSLSGDERSRLHQLHGRQLENLKLRDDYRAKMGDKFSLADFHDRLLAGGLAPMKIIRREMMGADGPVL